MSAMTRRTFLKASSGACAFGATTAAGSRGQGIDEPRHKNGSIAIIDVHLHLFEDLEENERILAQCKKAGIDKICAFLSGGCSTGTIADDPNRVVMELRKRHPDDVIAFARADGHDGRKAVDELTRVVEDHNFRGLKQSFNVKASDPAIFPLVEGRAVAPEEFEQLHTQGEVADAECKAVRDSYAEYEQQLAEVNEKTDEISRKHSEAIDIMEDLLNRDCHLSQARLRHDPVWDPLHKEPRFQRLLKSDK